MSLTVGVGSRSRVAVNKSFPFGRPSWRFASGPLVPSRAVGVGSSSTTMRRSVTVVLAPPGIVAFRASICSAVPPGWLAVGVGSKDEEPGTTVGGAHFRCSKQAPLRIEPRFGQIGEDSPKADPEVPLDVLQYNVSGS